MKKSVGKNIRLRGKSRRDPVILPNDFANMTLSETMRRRQFWKPVAVAVVITALLACLATGAGTTAAGHSDLAVGLLPDAGPLDVLPSGPGHRLSVSELSLFYSDPLLSGLSSRGPPLS